MCDSAVLGRTFILLVLTIAVFFGESAQAERRPHANFLVLPFKRDGNQDPTLRNKIFALARRFGKASQPELSQKDLECQTKECLQTLARSYNSADYILIGSIETASRADATMETNVISVTLYPVATWQGETASGKCIACSAVELHKTILDYAQQLLQALKLDEVKSCSVGYKTFGRGLAHGAFSGLAVSGLIGGAALTVANDQRPVIETVSGPITLQPQLGSYMTLTYAAMGVGVLGTLLTGLLHRKPRDAEQQCGVGAMPNRLFYKGVLLGAASTLLVSSLISAATLTTYDGKPCVEGRPDISCSFFPSQKGVAWGFTAVWAVGLGLTFAFR